MILAPRKKPLLCCYYLTYRCNAGCAFCDIPSKRDGSSNDFAAIDDVERNLRQLRENGLNFVDFTGGEPLLYAELPRALHYAKKLGLYTTLTTNTILYEHVAGEIRGLVDFLHFSLDGMSAKVHDGLRGVACFSKVMHAIGLARELGETPDLLFTATEANFKEIEPLAKFARKRRCMLIVNPEFNNGAASLGRDALRYLDQYRSEPFVYSNRALISLRCARGNQISAPRCRAVTACAVISPDNELLLPCFHRAASRVPIGERIDDALSSAARTRALQLQGRYRFCQGCTINCYFDPSFLYRYDGYFVQSQYAKLKYGYDKYLRAHAQFPRRYLKHRTMNKEQRR
jgi:MoaA/NifB/PqqE/SkfB family radical SAM enzyme